MKDHHSDCSSSSWEHDYEQKLTINCQIIVKTFYLKKHNVNLIAKGKIWGSLKSMGFVLWGPCISVPNFVPI